MLLQERVEDVGRPIQAIGEPFERAAGSFGFDSHRVEKRLIAFAIQDDDRPVPAADQLRHQRRQTNRRLAAARGPHDVHVFAKEFGIEQDGILGGRVIPEQERPAFELVAAGGSAMGEAVCGRAVGYLFRRTRAVQNIVMRQQGRHCDDVHDQRR